jgi:hypothetical protein
LIIGGCTWWAWFERRNEVNQLLVNYIISPNPALELCRQSNVFAQAISCASRTRASKGCRNKA